MERGKKKSSVKLQSRVNKLQIIFSILFNGLTKTSIIFHRFPSETYCTQNLINSVKSSDHEADLNLIRASNALPREREREGEGCTVNEELERRGGGRLEAAHASSQAGMES